VVEMFNKKLSMEKRTSFSKLVPAVALGIILFFLFLPQTAIATYPAGTVLIIDNDNDVYFEDDQSVSIFQSAFEDLGYAVKIERSDATSYSTWSDYDLVVWSCGDDMTPISCPEYKKMLVDYIKEGGHLILESGHIATWIKRFGDQAIDYELCKKVLHAKTDGVYCDVGNLTLSTQHPIKTTSNPLPDTIGFTPTNPGDDSGDADAVMILPNSVGVLNWSSVANMSNPVEERVAHISYGLIAYDNDADETNGGQIVYYAFDIDDIGNPDIQCKLIENTELWLKGKIQPTPTPVPGFEIVFVIVGVLIAVYFIIRKRT
jgi:PGF-CTERM protein